MTRRELRALAFQLWDRSSKRNDAVALGGARPPSPGRSLRRSQGRAHRAAPSRSEVQMHPPCIPLLNSVCEPVRFFVQNSTMFLRKLACLLGALALAALVGGCKKSDQAQSPPSTPPKPQAPSEVIARLHWLGKKRLGSETNAAFFMGIWNQPDSTNVEAFVLDKLALAPWRDWNSNAPASVLHARSTADFDHLVASQPAAARLRPILQDLVDEESYLEIRQATNQPGEIGLAIRLSPERAALWQTNLAAVLESLTGSRPERTNGGSGWSTSVRIHPPRPPFSASLTRLGDWTLVGLAPAANSVVADLVQRIQQTHNPFPLRATNFWIETEFNPQRIAGAFPLGWKISDNFPSIAATAIGDGQDVRSRAELTFPQGLALNLEPWKIPTNLVFSSLISFSAVRGLAPVLSKTKLFSGLGPEDVPDQAFEWDLTGLPFKTFFALPVEHATNCFGHVAPVLENWLRFTLSPGRGAMSIDPRTPALRIEELPFCSPFLQLVAYSGQQFLFGGFGPHFFKRSGDMPVELANHILQATNLVYFDWEITGQRLIHWRYLDDVAHISFDTAHTPRLLPMSPNLLWVSDVSSNLSHCVTEMKINGAHELNLARKSSIGLTSLEIDFLANWVESAEFPHDILSVLRKSQTPALVHHRLGEGK